jgi:hypothetical protein
MNFPAAWSTLRERALIKDINSYGKLKSEIMPRISLCSRRVFLKYTIAGTAAMAGGRPCGRRTARAASDAPLLDAEDAEFLKALAAATLEKARVRPGETRDGMPKNSQGFTLITPGGHYPALWVRDFAMSLDCGLVRPQEILDHLQLIARCQNGEKERRLKSGGIIPPFAIPDHINFDGGAVFYPATYSPGEDQGVDPWGPLPPQDDHYYFIHVAYALWRDSRDAAFLNRAVEGLSIFQRLVKAFHSPLSDPKTGAAVSPKDRRAVGFGFEDSVYLLGSMSFATLLRYRAAKQLAELSRQLKKEPLAEGFEAVAKTIVEHFTAAFTRPEKIGGWLLGATELGRQPDVWATLFALHLGVLPKDAARRARETVAAAVQSPGNSVEYLGAARHVPANLFFRPGQCWEKSFSATGTYQSGAFWHTPTGWLIEALRPDDPDLARAVCRRCLDHLRREDFRKAQGRGAPWECFGLKLVHAQNPVYLTSVTLPLSILQRLK